MTERTQREGAGIPSLPRRKSPKPVPNPKRSSRTILEKTEMAQRAFEEAMEWQS